MNLRGFLIVWLGLLPGLFIFIMLSRQVQIAVAAIVIVGFLALAAAEHFGILKRGRGEHEPRSETRTR